jgi:hypothetical protein
VKMHSILLLERLKNIEHVTLCSHNSLRLAKTCASLVEKRNRVNIRRVE